MCWYLYEMYCMDFTCEVQWSAYNHRTGPCPTRASTISQTITLPFKGAKPVSRPEKFRISRMNFLFAHLGAVPCILLDNISPKIGLIYQSFFWWCLDNARRKLVFASLKMQYPPFWWSLVPLRWRLRWADWYISLEQIWHLYNALPSQNKLRLVKNLKSRLRNQKGFFFSFWGMSG